MRRAQGTLVISLLLCCSAVSIAADDDVAIETVTQEAVIALGTEESSPVTILDVRTPEEYSHGHIRGAVNIPVDDIEARQAELAPFKDGPVIVYCRTGPRALRAIATLRALGFTDIAHLEGGMAAWVEAERPVAID